MKKKLSLQDIYIRDPYILPYQGKFYLYGTTDPQAWKGAANGFKAYVSDDLVTFEEHVVFKNSPSFWGVEQFWAPEVHVVDGRFYLIAAFSAGDEIRRIHVLEADRPLGPFLPKPHPLFEEKFSHLDGTYVEEGNRRFIIFSKEWTDLKDKDGEMLAVEVNEKLDAISSPKLLFKASQAPWTTPINDGAYVTDGPFVLRNDVGGFTMIWSSFSSSGYTIGQCLAAHADGPYVHQKEILVSENGGHGMIFQKEGKMYLTYHKPNDPHLQERCVYREVYFDRGVLKVR